MSGAVYELQIVLPEDQIDAVLTWFNQALRRLLEVDGFESGRLYRPEVTSTGSAPGLILQARVSDADALAAWRAVKEAAFLETVRERYGQSAVASVRVLAPVAEIATPSAADGNPAVTECPNCGGSVRDRFCARCGQNNQVSVVAFPRLFSEVLKDALDLDSRLFRSAWLLLLRPGALTVEYLAGRRVRYLPPVRMFVFLSLFFFGTISLLATEVVQVKTAADDASREVLEIDRDVEVEGSPDAMLSLDSENRVMRWLEERMRRNLTRLRDDPDFGNDLIARGIGYLPVMMFLLAPAYALLMKLLYLPSGRYYVEHLVFTLHLHAFLFLTLGVILLGSAALEALSLTVPFPALPAAAWWTWFVLYPLLAMRRVYAQGWLRTGFKFLLVLLGYLPLLATGLGVTALVSLSV